MKKRMNCESCGIALDKDAKYCKYCGRERTDVSDDFIEETPVEPKSSTKIRYCKYCGKRFIKNEPCKCKAALAEAKRLESEAAKALKTEKKIREKTKKTVEPKMEESRVIATIEPKMEESRVIATIEPKVEESRIIATVEPKVEESRIIATVEPKVEESKVIATIETKAEEFRAISGSECEAVIRDGDAAKKRTGGSSGSSKARLLIAAAVILTAAVILAVGLISGDKKGETDTEVKQTEPAVVLLDENEIPTEEPAEVPTEEPTEVLTEEPTEVPTEEPVKWIYGYEGSYIANSNAMSVIYMLNANNENVSYSVPDRTVFYVEKAKEEDGQIWGCTSYGGLKGMIVLKDFSRISSEDYSVHDSTECFVNSQHVEGIGLYSESNLNSEIYVQIPFGIELLIEKQENAMGYTSYGGQRGWVLMNQITPFYTELAYRVAAGEAGSIALKQQPNASAAEFDMIADGTILLVDDLQNGWCKTAYNGITGWICAADLKPAGDSTVMNFGLLEVPDEEVTVIGDTTMFKDGTPVLAGGYIMPDSENRYLTESDLDRLTLKGLCYAKNEIYARYGRRFKSQELMNYFEGQTWYSGIYEPDESTDAQIVSWMNEYERYNKDLLWKEEQQQGTYVLDSDSQEDNGEASAASSKVHTYEIFLADVSWEQAMENCISEGGYLVRFESQDEYAYILEELESRGYDNMRFYIGGRRDLDSGQYYWTDNKNSLFGDSLNGGNGWYTSAWMDGEPSYHDATIDETEHVLEIFYYDDENRWVWNDIPNNLPEYVSAGKIGYICEYED